jgi:hypothetical protein
MTPCSACHRHVRFGERVCPFCAAKIALVALGVGLAACGDKPAQGPTDVNAMDGGSPSPVTTGTSTAPAAPDAGMPRGGEVYGGPPPRK